MSALAPPARGRNLAQPDDASKQEPARQARRRLRLGPPTEADLLLLDEYRRSLREPYEAVVHVVRDPLLLEPTGRPAKSTQSVIDKLRRERVRLTQIQDIAGCRVVVPGMIEQEHAIAALRLAFPDSTVVDRRAQPSHDYRAVHVIVRCPGGVIEIQVRTALQHRWAELSEKLTDVVDPAIKYGGGDQLTRSMLARASAVALDIERSEMDVAHQMRAFLEELARLKQGVTESLDRLIATLAHGKDSAQ